MTKKQAIVGIAILLVLGLVCWLPARAVIAGWHMHRGFTLAHSGDYPGAVSEERVAVQLTPGSALAHNNLAWYLYKSGDFAEALPESREALRINAHDAYSHDTLGAILSHMGQYPEAIQQCREAVRLRPSATHRNTLAYALYKGGHKEEAQMQWQQSVATGSFADSEEARKMLAQYH